ncbi:MAG: hypothetical protein CMJ46_12420 [Planctomyces sp.]|nr:hypothetical protein [Planctomyces sp.]
MNEVPPLIFGPEPPDRYVFLAQPFRTVRTFLLIMLVPAALTFLATVGIERSGFPFEQGNPWVGPMFVLEIGGAVFFMVFLVLSAIGVMLWMYAAFHNLGVFDPSYLRSTADLCVFLQLMPGINLVVNFWVWSRLFYGSIPGQPHQKPWYVVSPFVFFRCGAMLTVWLFPFLWFPEGDLFLVTWVFTSIAITTWAIYSFTRRVTLLQEAKVDELRTVYR